MKTFIRFHYEQGLTLKEMREKAKKEFGLCCYKVENEDELFKKFLPQVLENKDEGEIIIFEGRYISTCVEDSKAVPSRILERYNIKANSSQKGEIKNTQIERI